MNEKNKIEELKSMSLGDHLEELRARLMLCIAGIFGGLIFGMLLGKRLLKFLSDQYGHTLTQAGIEPKMQVMKIHGAFLVYLKISLLFGIVLASPWIFYQLWAFVSAGLYKRERKFVYIISPISSILFITGAVFFFFVVAPLAMLFFAKFNLGIDFLSYNPTLESYISFVLSLTLVFGLGFQTPIAVVFANRLGLVTIKALKSARRYVILGLFVVAAMATPPDIISQVALAVPLYFLYESSIIVCWILDKRRPKKPA